MYAMSSLRCPSRKQQIRSQSFAILMPSAFLLSFAWMSPLPAIALLNQWLCGLTRPDWLDGAQPKEGLSVVLLVISSWGVWLGKRRQLLHALQLEFIIEKIQSLSRILLVTELKSHKVDLGPGQQWLAESLRMRNKRMGRTMQRCCEKVGVGGVYAVLEGKGDRQAYTQVHTQTHSKCPRNSWPLSAYSFSPYMLFTLGTLKKWTIFASVPKWVLKMSAKLDELWLNIVAL